MWKYNHTELYHYGIPGMRWGQRKASNDSVDLKNIRTKKMMFERTNTELDRANNRMQKEITYYENVNKINRGRIVTEALTSTANWMEKLPKQLSRLSSMGKGILHDVRNVGRWAKVAVMTLKAKQKS